MMRTSRPVQELMATRRWCHWLDKTAPDPSNKPGEKPRYRVSIVIENESGHVPTGDPEQFQQPWYWTEEVCEQINRERLHLLPEEVTYIVASSMGAGPVRRGRRRG